MSATLGAAFVAAQFVPGLDVAVDAVALGIAGAAAVGVIGAEIYQHAGHQAVQANTKADEQLKDADASEPCVECGDALPCFNTPAGQSEAEAKKQLQDQQDLINSQTPQQMQDRLDAADKRKADTGSYRPEGDAAKREKTRGKFQKDRAKELAEQFEEQGRNPEEAEQMASTQTIQEMKSLDATHALDSIAGGGERDAMGMGSKSINRSIGSQWKTRVQALKDAVKKALQRGDEKMNIRLEPCED